MGYGLSALFIWFTFHFAYICIFPGAVFCCSIDFVGRVRNRGGLQQAYGCPRILRRNWYQVNSPFLLYSFGPRLIHPYSGWIYAVCSQHNSTKNPELATLFSRCGHLLRLPIFPLFVFDGPARPSNKRGKYVRGDEHWMTVDIKKMLTAFGFRWIVVRSTHNLI